MRVAVLTLTRDRLDSTQHCFQRLKERAGCDYDHYVLDQGSQDGTPDWLQTQDLHTVILRPGNAGISRGMNRLLDEARSQADYDAYVKFDNDCELVEPGTLARILHLITDEWILSPRVLGLHHPQTPAGYVQHRGEQVGMLGMVGGIFLAAPASVYRVFRYNPGNPAWGLDDNEVCSWHRARGGSVGYVMSLSCNHHLTTAGQEQTYPEYFQRKRAEAR